MHITKQMTSLNEVKQELQALAASSHIETKKWSLYEILVHSAQTIQYSMTGYPQMKPKLIRNTIGKVVIKRFLRKGMMKHDLTAHVPGSEGVKHIGTNEEGISILLDTIEKFQAYDGELQPHLIFGSLSKEEYDQYFAMHIADHLSELEYK